jgi:pimeloyl-ACP methyl ester carboxylesterase
MRAHAAMSARSAFMPLHLARRFPAIRWDVADAATVEARHGGRFADPFPAPAAAAIETSREMASPGERVRWLRFPSGADTAWARVAAPKAVRDPPTLIFLHGIAMEAEFWRRDPRLMLRGLVEAGVRLVQPEGPWHGRRRKRGWFGGEPVMAQGPLGMLDFFERWVGEVAQLVAWARATSRGPVALGGVSLGALTSQLAGVAAARWPEAMRPDALFLVATSGDVIDAALEGRLGAALGAPARLATAGWTPPLVARWRPLLDPLGVPAVDPSRIVMVLGEEDVVTPFKGGSALAGRWGVPRRNVFLRPQGHFSVALGLSRRAAPLRRLLEVLR